MHNFFTCKSGRAWLAGLVMVFTCLALPDQAGAQTYGNEWINFSQPYYKVQVAKDGIYRLTYSNLTAMGITNADPRKFQLFRRGQEVAIYVAGQADGTLDPTDYIEFYGQRNDGGLDTELYKDPAHQVHTFYSLYTDTASYFLTISPTANGKRMIEQNIPTTGLTPEPYHFKEQMVLRLDNYNKGRYIAWDNFLPWMDLGEGYFSRYSSEPQNNVIDSVLQVNTTGPKPVLEVALLGAGFRTIMLPHNVDIFVVPPGGTERLIGNATFPTFEYRKLKYQIEFSDIASDGKVTVRYIPKNTAPGTPNPIKEIIRFAYARVIFPQNTQLNGKSAVILTDSAKTGPLLYQAQNAPANAVAYDITDPYNITRVEGYAAGADKNFVISAPAIPGTRRKIFIANPQSPLAPTPGQRVHFRQISPANHNFIIISHKVLTKPFQNYTNPPKDYAAYKASPVGGSHDTLLVMMDQLYDQFHYGERSSGAISRFMNFMINNGDPKYLLLLGKGLEADFGFFAPGSGQGGYRKNPTAFTLRDLVPTGGAPGSDILFTADWKNNSYFPRVPTGRVSAVTSADIVSYLEKVKTHDTLSVAEWRKNMLHLGGGQTQVEIQTFRNYLNNYKRMAEGPFLGALVKSIFKETTTGTVLRIKVDEEVNRGLSLITFFGHSSTNVTDIDIGLASDPINGYNNYGKYPMILLNGCSSGNTFSSGTFGEDWMLTPRKGSILFLAHSWAGFDSYLNIYSENFYRTAFTDSAFYGKSIGEIQAQTAKATIQNRTNFERAITTVMEMVLQGDPSVALFSPEKPDYAINGNSLFLRPINEALVTARSDSFEIGIPIKNLGKATNDSFYVSVKRRFSGALISETDSVLAGPVYNQDTVFVTIDARGTNAFGLNSFEVFVDHTNKVDELNELNNIATFDYFFPLSGVMALLPAEYSIVNGATVNLVGQSTDLLTKDKDYYFEIDTTYRFNSPFFKSNTVTNAGILPVWENVQLLTPTMANDSIVYYWRLRFKDINPGEDTVWAESSFRHIPTSPGGWSQSEYGQFTKATRQNISVKESRPNWSFTQLSSDIQLRTVGGAVPFDYPPYGIFVNNEIYFNNFCQWTNNNIMAIVFDDKTLQPFASPAKFTGSGFPCGVPSRVYHFSSLNNPAFQDRLRRFLDSIPDNFYVAMVSTNNVPFTDFDPAVKAAFSSIGSSLIHTLQSGDPFAIMGRKGAAPGTICEKTFDPNLATRRDSQVVILDCPIFSALQSGQLTSTRIGPATEWKTLYHTVRQQAGDTYQLKVIGYNSQGSQTVLEQDVKARAFSLANIDAAQYPYLELQLLISDSLNRTAPQLKEWMVTYEGVPEGIIRPDRVAAASYDLTGRLAQSPDVTVPFVFHNISDKNFSDSLTAVIHVVGPNSTAPADTIKLKQLLAGDTVQVNYAINARGMKGEYRLRINFNPQILPEQYYFNNSMEVPFTVNSSDLHPILDVTFDGVHIMDGDIVSPSPMISISLKDEDRIRFTENPDDIQIFQRYRGQEGEETPGFQEINMVTSGADITFFKGDLKNAARIEYNPKNLADGVYELQVQGKDVSGNLSGKERYSITFRVINESTITHFYPYPNPFTTSTRFVFTLTGSVIPQAMKIQIMTVTGKVVREITREELGPIRIGNNTSAYSWNGTDEFGDKLANGVYLYRVVIDHGPDEMKHRRTSADKAFKNNWGKMYILR